MPNTEIITKAELAKVEDVKKATSEIVNLADVLKITSAKSLEEGLALLKTISDKKKNLKPIKSYLVDPIKLAYDRAKGLFTPIETALADAEYTVKGKISAYNEKLKAEELKKAKEAQAAVEAGKITEAEAGQKIAKAEVKRAPIPTTRLPEMTIVDEKLVPDEYWIIDRVALRAAALAAFKDGGRQLPGVKVEIVEHIVNR